MNMQNWWYDDRGKLRYAYFQKNFSLAILSTTSPTWTALGLKQPKNLKTIQCQSSVRLSKISACGFVDSWKGEEASLETMQIGFRAHPASWSVGTGGSFPRDKVRA
jgi:hypothetical protein